MDENEVIKPEEADDIITKIVKTSGKYPRTRKRRTNDRSMRDIVLYELRRKINRPKFDENGNQIGVTCTTIRKALVQVWIDLALKGNKAFSLILKDYMDSEVVKDDLEIKTVDDMIRKILRK